VSTGARRASSTEPAAARERRRHARVPLFSLVEMRADDCDEFFSEMAVDISLGGMFVETPAPYAHGAFVEVRLQPDLDLPPIEGVARVAFKAGEGVGLRFLHLVEPSLSYVHEVVRRRVSA
jgi:hypothetical protein